MTGASILLAFVVIAVGYFTNNPFFRGHLSRSISNSTRGIGCGSTKYPAVGIRTSASIDDFVRTKTCEIAIDPPSYFECPVISENPSRAPSKTPTHVPSYPHTIAPVSNSPSKQPSLQPSALSVQQGVTFPPTKVRLQTEEPTLQCISKPNPCSSGDVCCGSAVCSGGFCRTLPAYKPKDDLKITRAKIGSIRGSFVGPPSPNESSEP